MLKWAQVLNLHISYCLVFSHFKGKEELPFMWESNWNAWSFALGWTISQLGAPGLGLEGKPTWLTF